MSRIQPSPINPTLARLRRTLVLRANSLLITIFGDAIAPRQQSVWLGSLIALLEPFGLSPRLVRTSAFRLTADDWFVATRLGRRSFYGLSEIGMQRVQHADQRIYEFNLPQWDGVWTLALLDTGLRASERHHLQRELKWEGFGQLAPHVFAHPHVNHGALAEIIEAAGAQDQVALLQASSLTSFASRPLQTIMHDTFELKRVSDAWKLFVKRFEPVLVGSAQLLPADAFLARTLLIHEYRKVLLRDPNLPAAFLPVDWPGIQARQLCEQLYGELLKASEHHLRELVQTTDGMLARTPVSITRRLAHRESTPAGRAGLKKTR